jgi:hypothetical protein
MATSAYTRFSTTSVDANQEEGCHPLRAAGSPLCEPTLDGSSALVRLPSLSHGPAFDDRCAGAPQIELLLLRQLQQRRRMLRSRFGITGVGARNRTVHEGESEGVLVTDTVRQGQCFGSSASRLIWVA